MLAWQVCVCGTGIWEWVRNEESPTWDTDSADLLYCEAVFFLHSLWTSGELTGALEYPTIPLSVWGGTRLRPAPEGTSLKTVGPVWGSASFLESSIVCHIASQGTWALLLLGLYGSLPIILQVPPRGSYTHWSVSLAHLKRLSEWWIFRFYSWEQHFFLKGMHTGGLHPYQQ